MALTFNLRHLERRELHLWGEQSADELDVANVDELVRMSLPLRYDVWIEKIQQNVLARGQLKFVLECHCSRCLKPFHKEIEIADWSCDLPLEGEDKVTVEQDCVDLTPIIREDILLAFPQHPLCQSECGGLPLAKRKYPIASETKASEVTSPAWDELNKLKL